MPSAYLQWRFHSGERVVARGPLVFFISVWQHPYVNAFKHFNISSWKKSTKEGEVSTVMVIKA